MLTNFKTTAGVAHAQHYLNVCREAHSLLSSDPAAAIQRVSEVLDQLIEAHQWIADSVKSSSVARELAVSYPLAVEPFDVLPVAVEIEWWSLASKHVRFPHFREKADRNSRYFTVKTRYASACQRAGDLKKAVSLAMGEPEHAHELHLLESECEALSVLGSCHVSIGHYHVAIHELKNARKKRRKLWSQRGIASEAIEAELRTMGALAQAYSMLGMHRRAIMCAKRCLRLARRARLRTAEGTAHQLVAMAYINRVTLARPVPRWVLIEKTAHQLVAVPYINRVTLSRPAPRWHDLIEKVLFNFRLGDLYHAQHHASTAVLMAQSGGSRQKSFALLGLGTVDLLLGRTEIGIDCLRRAHDITVECNDQPAEAIILNHLGVAYEKARRFVEAARCHRRNMALSRQARDPHSEANALENLGGVHQKLGRPNAARKCFQQAHAIVETFDIAHSKEVRRFQEW
jgi:tetratricopeptide (TPR) repeat protein